MTTSPTEIVQIDTANTIDLILDMLPSRIEYLAEKSARYHGSLAQAAKAGVNNPSPVGSNDFAKS
jgi:hypothetical protein